MNNIEEKNKGKPPKSAKVDFERNQDKRARLVKYRNSEELDDESEEYLRSNNIKLK